jgi:hypothetical protein
MAFQGRRRTERRRRPTTKRGCAEEKAEAARVQADLAELGRLRHYLIFGTQARRSGDCDKLMNAIDDYVEEMSGDRTALHAKNHKCG